jgi:hypothetical protein
MTGAIILNNGGTNMGRIMKQIIIVVAACSMLCVTPETQASTIVLTEEVVARYEDTYPEIWKVTKELDKIGKIPAADERTKKSLELIEKRADILKTKGWADFWEYQDTMARIMHAIIPLSVLEKFANSSEQDRKKAEDTVMEQLVDKDYAEDEIRTLIQHLPKLRKMIGSK